jgi:hypothetical protein
MLERSIIAGAPALCGRDPDGNQFVIVDESKLGPLAFATLTVPAVVAERHRELLTQTKEA